MCVCMITCLDAYCSMCKRDTLYLCTDVQEGYPISCIMCVCMITCLDAYCSTCLDGYCSTFLDGYCSTFLDGYCSTLQALLDWFEVDLGFTELFFIQIDLRVLSLIFVLKIAVCRITFKKYPSCTSLSLSTLSHSRTHTRALSVSLSIPRCLVPFLSLAVVVTF